MSKKQLYDSLGSSLYPNVLPDSTVYDSNATYEGERVFLSKNACKISSLQGLQKHTASTSVQGILYRDGELFQFFAGGSVDVYDIESSSYLRSFTIPNAPALHFGGIDWLSDSSNVFVTHSYDTNSLYIIDISNESSISVTAVSTPSIPASVISSEGIVSVDRLNGIVYLSGYLRSDPSNPSSSRIGISIYQINPSTGAASHVIDINRFFHLQDNTWSNGRIFYCNDKNVDSSSGYDTLGMVVIDITKGIVANLTIPGVTGKEAEGICTVDNEYVLFTYKASSNSIGEYRIDLF